MLLFTKQVEAGLPEHVVKMFLGQSTHRLTARMRNIIKNALRLPQPTATQAATARGVKEASTLIASRTMTPSQRRAEAVKRKLDNEICRFIIGQCGRRQWTRKEEKEKDRSCQGGTKVSHQKMCAKAMDKYLDNVNK